MKSLWLTRGKLAAFHIFYQMVTQIFSLLLRFLSSHFFYFFLFRDVVNFFLSLFAFYKQFICGGSKIYFIMYAKCEKNTFAENVRFFVWATQPSRRAEKHIKNMHKAPSTVKRNVRFFPAVFIVMLQVLVESPIIHYILYTLINGKSHSSDVRKLALELLYATIYTNSVIISALFDDAIAYILSLLRVGVSQSLFLRVKNCHTLRCQWNLAFEWNKSNFPSTEFVLLEFSNYFFPKPTRLASWTINIAEFLVFHIKVINYLLFILLAYARWNKSNNRINFPLFFSGSTSTAHTQMHWRFFSVSLRKISNYVYGCWVGKTATKKKGNDKETHVPAVRTNILR